MQCRVDSGHLTPETERRPAANEGKPVQNLRKEEEKRTVTAKRGFLYARPARMVFSYVAWKRGEIIRNSGADPVQFFLAATDGTTRMADKKEIMFSHVVIFWTDPTQSQAADEVIAGAQKWLKPIPGVLQFHVGKMAASHRPVVDQTYQVGLNLVFADKKTQDEYQVHPLHLEFVEKCVRVFVKKVVVYDFE